MRRLLILLTLLNLLASCSHVLIYNTSPIPNIVNTQDPNLSEYVDRFKEDIGVENSKYWDSLKYGFTQRSVLSKISTGAVGVCRRHADGRREIAIATEYWNNITPAEKTVLIYHELAHCICDMPHGHMNGTYQDNMFGNSKDKGFFKDECPSSIMYPNVISDKCARQHWPQYVKEIKLRCEQLQLDDLFPMLERSCEEKIR